MALIRVIGTLDALVLGSVLLAACSSGASSAKSSLASPRASSATMRAADAIWSGPFGYIPNVDGVVYCLMANGFFQAPRSDDFDSLVAEWIAAHPDAALIPVTKIGGSTSEGLVYVWLADESSSLNLELVRQGACPGRSMVPLDLEAMRPLDPDEMLLPGAEFVRFKNQLARAERAARAEDLAIWRLRAGRR